MVPECPAFNEVFLNTPPLRHGLADAFRHEKLTPPGWLGEPAATTPMIPLEIDGKAYLVGKTGEPGKPSHQVAALYDPVKGWVTATYIDPEGKQAWLGDGQERLRKVLADYLNTSTPLSKAASDAGTALPVRLY
ncbi:hypothetical protein CBM2633_B60316 [Cupriavidus taiwanensis]|nr:hypothetical protein CBM2633_B60316 [Cupriavidus taiwanensis]